ncbi:PQQ-dependent sugar dehydrogenase [soil metagenome]
MTDGFDSPRVVAAAHDGTGRLFIGERYGTIRVVTAEGDLLPEPFLDISGLVLSAHQDSGLIGIAFHPDYETNGFFYATFTDINVNGAIVLAQFTVSPDNPNVADRGTMQEIMKTSHPTPILNGGTIHFGPDGYLYMSIGNGAFFGVHDLFTAQEMDNHLGKILRLDITNEEGGAGYRIPPDNPYNMSYTYWNAQHVWAMGLRNSWGFSFDPVTGDMYIPDTGEANWEEINFIPAGSPGGQNFGWPIWEGMHCVNFYTTGSCAQTGIPPVAEYPHGDYGCAVVGLGVYRGSTASFIDGFYLAADYCTGKIWGLSRDPAGGWIFQELLDVFLLVPGGGNGEDGELYVLSCNCGLGPGKESGNPGRLWRVDSVAHTPEGVEIAPID